MGIARKPRCLAFCVLAGANLDEANAFLPRNLTREQVADFTQPDDLFRSRADRTGGSHFLDDPSREHRLGARIDTVGQIGTVTFEDGTLERDARMRTSVTETGKGSACEEADLEGADDSARISAINRSGAFGVKRSKPLDEIDEWLGCEFRAKRFIGGRHLGKSVGEGADVESCSANDERAVSPRGDFTDTDAGHIRIVGSVASLSGGYFPDEMMRYPCQRFRVRFGRQKIQPAIDLKSIRADNFSVKMLGEVSGQV